MKNEPIEELFRLALEHVLKHKRHGAKAAIARDTGVTQQYIGAIVKGRRYGNETLRRAIANSLGYTYDDFLDLGRKIASKEVASYEPQLPFQSELETLGKDTLAKYHLIYAKAAAETGYPGVRDYIDRALGIAPDEYKAFEAGEISAYDLYELAKQTLIEDMEDIKKRMRRWEELTKDVKRKNVDDIF
jgi:transcriptional regulator with XRE-family HTH domain